MNQIDEIRIINAPGGVAVQQIEAGIVVKAHTYATKEQAQAAVKRLPNADIAEDWTEADSV